MTETAPTGIQNDHTTDSQEDATLASVRVIEAVAEATDEDPLAMAPLSEAIDADALDSLDAAAFDGRVQFAYAGHHVTVHGDGTVEVAGRGA